MKQWGIRAEDITYLPYFIIYQYYFACLKVYAFFTLHITAWGTRDASAFEVTVNEHSPSDSVVTIDVKVNRRRALYAAAVRKSNVASMRRIYRQAFLDPPDAAEEQVCMYVDV